VDRSICGLGRNDRNIISDLIENRQMVLVTTANWLSCYPFAGNPRFGELGSLRLYAWLVRLSALSRSVDSTLPKTLKPFKQDVNTAARSSLGITLEI